MKKEPILVALGSTDDLRSSVWRLWVQGAEVYFGPRQMLPTLKVSLHKSGNWRIAWVRSLKRGGSDDRAIMKWRRPDEFEPGLVNGVMVLVYPIRSRDPFRNKAILDSKIEWLSLPQPGKILALIVLIAGPAADLGRLGGTRIVGRIKKDDGEEVLLVAYEMDLTEAIRERMIEEKSKVKIHAEEGKSDKLTLTDQTRAVFFVPPGAPSEMPAIYDILLDWDNIATH